MLCVSKIRTHLILFVTLSEILSSILHTNGFLGLGLRVYGGPNYRNGAAMNGARMLKMTFHLEVSLRVLPVTIETLNG
jgi:hypothetical protein